jgi:hypothetical protein
MTRQLDLFAPEPVADGWAGRDQWKAQARQIAKRHAARDNWLGRRWDCECGACRTARWDGFIPRQSIARYR